MLAEKLKYRYRSLRYRYLLDVQELKYIIHSLNPGDVCVDIGCHKGGYLYWFQKRVGQSGKVYAFEPQVKLFQYLKEISNLYQYNNVTLENLGLSDKPGVTDLYIPKSKNGTSPGARIDLLDDKNNYLKESIELVTLDQYFLHRKIFPKIIKIDVEGHEKKVLHGGMELIKSCKPKLVIECEYRHLKDGEDIVEVYNFLNEFGYNGYFYLGNKLRPFSEFDKNKHQKVEFGNYWDKRNYVNNFIFDTRKLSVP
jgi:FkbM family methyltransferase